MIKEIFTGGKRVQDAKTTIAKLESKSILNTRQRRALQEAERVTRRHFIGLGLKAALGVAAIGTGGVILRERFSRNNFQTPEAPSIPEGLSQEKLEAATRIAVRDFNRLFNSNLNEDYIVSRTQLVETETEFYRLIGGDLSNRLGITYTYGDKNEKTIFINKEEVQLAMRALTKAENLGLLQQEMFEMVMKHELVHFSSVRYQSEQLHDLVYESMVKNLPEFKGKELVHRFVEGADIVAHTKEGSKIRIFHALEEAEAHVISDFAMRERGRKLIVIPFDPEVIEVTAQVSLLEKALATLSPDPSVRIPMLQRFRTTVGGREEFCRALAAAKKDVPIGQELFYGMSLLFAVSKGDASLFKTVSGM